MILYCDALDGRLTAAAIVLRLRGRGAGAWRLRLFDPMRAGLPRLYAAVLRGCGFQIDEPDFFAGHLEGPNGQPIPLAARAQAFELCYEVAERLLASIPTLERLNAREGRNTIVLHLAKRTWLPLERIVMGGMIADALAARDGHAVGGVWMHSEWPFETGSLRTLIRRDHLRVWPARTVWGRMADGIVALVAAARRLARGRLSPRSETTRALAAPDSTESGSRHQRNLLLLEEGDPSMDRSLRTQPHWLFPGDSPAFDTFLMTVDGASAAIGPDLEQYRVRRPAVPRTAMWTYRRTCRRLSEAMVCLSASLTASGVAQRRALRTIAALHWHAYGLFVIGRHHAISAWMTCENYVRDADAMVLAAAELGGSTISYQYANVAISSPALMTTADTMVTFAPSFNPLWVRSGGRRIGPARFQSDGYPFTSSFALLRTRARQHRAALSERGARFVICYFDESVIDTKYALIDEREHRAEIMQLLRLVADDADVGLIVKTQFRRNSPSVLYSGSDDLNAARQTGRYLELVQGSHRNIVFPAEAAMASDIAIGHLVGGTAPLEAALAGARAVMLNPFAVAGRHASVYQRANILFPSLPAALDAIHAFRAGERHARDLGDWTSILPVFDPYRDGRAAQRMRARLDTLLTETPSSMAAAAAPDR